MMRFILSGGFVVADAVVSGMSLTSQHWAGAVCLLGVTLLGACPVAKSWADHLFYGENEAAQALENRG